MITIIALLIALPFAVLLDILSVARFFRGFHLNHATPRDAELTKASHGAAVLVICAGALHLAGRAEIQKFTDALQAWPDDPLHWAPALLFVLAVAWGVLWFTTGSRRALAFGAERDSRILSRALFKIASGLVLALIVWNAPAAWSSSLAGFRALPFATDAAMVLVAWLVVTGSTKFLLVARGRRRPRPVPIPATKPPARDATEDEAYEDMRGLGGRKTALDDMRF